MHIHIGDDIICPNCNKGEVVNPDDPVKDWKMRIRANKVFNNGLWWSNCLDCDLWFSGNIVETPQK